MKPRSVRILLIAMASLLGSASWSAAQQPLPTTVVESSNPDPSEIENFVRGPLAALASNDFAQIKQAREMLLSPFKGGRPSVGFRLAYTDKTLPALRELAKNSRDDVATNAIRVVADLGTPRAAEFLGSQLRDSRVAVRIFAAMGAKRMMDLVRPDVQPALDQADLLTLVDQLGDRLLEETSASALDGAVRALDAGVSLRRDALDSVRHRALTRLCVSGITRARALPPWAQSAELLPPLLRAQITVREVLTGARPALAPTDAEILRAIEFEAQMIAVAVSNLRTLNNDPPEARTTLADIVRVGESAIVVGLPKVRDEWRSRNMAESLAKGAPQGDQEFQRNALELFTKLQAEPFRLGPFLK